MFVIDYNDQLQGIVEFDQDTNQMKDTFFFCFEIFDEKKKKEKEKENTLTARNLNILNCVITPITFSLVDSF